MRYAAVASVLLLTTGALSVTAQTTALAGAPVRAAVGNRPLSMTSAGVTDFGSVTGADVVTGSGSAAINAVAPGPGQSTAMFSIAGEPNVAVSVTCGPALPLILSSDGSQFIYFLPFVVHSTNPANQLGAFGGCTAASAFFTPLGADGALHLWLGGNLNIGSHNPPTAGLYTSTYTISIAY